MTTGSSTVFVVDDDDDVRESLRELLGTAGFEVETFDSAQSFLSGPSMPRQGCLIVDLRMPGMNGLELQQKLAADGVKLPVIIVTGHADVPLAVQAMKAGAIDFIEKPYTYQTIVGAVQTALSSLAPASASPPGSGSGSVVVPEQISRRLAQLTARERDVLDQLVVGHPNKVIALNLQISPRTVEIHRANMMDKLGAGHAADAIRLRLEAQIDEGRVRRRRRP